MGRRYTTGASINKFFAAIRANNARIERENLINQSASTEKELPIQYELESVDFEPNTRLATIQIKSTKKYRTIDRYVTQNYVRYPVYSFWKTKTSHITKKIKLTNQNLENLNAHSDELIRQFADEIILSLHDDTLIPSWLVRKIVDNEYFESLGNYNKQIGELNKTFERRVEADNIAISEFTPQLQALAKQRDKLNLTIIKLSNKIKKIKDHKPRLILSIITLGINAFLFSNYRERKLQRKLEEKRESLNNVQSEIDSINNEIKDIRAAQDIGKTKKNKDISDIRHKINELVKIHDEELRLIEPLSITVETSDFTPLKRFIGLEYQKIIGCYIIHNTERDKYYVGQSKDVMKRLRQHFKGTVPNNMIFAEDYFNSKLSSKDDIFEIKIIPLSTKDELDSNEARLIVEYEANTKGYNSTKGNS